MAQSGAGTVFLGSGWRRASRLGAGTAGLRPRRRTLHSTCKLRAGRPQNCVDAEIILPNGPRLRLSSGKLAKFADGSAVATMGQTSVLATSVCKEKPSFSNGSPPPPASFVPLTVDYRQKAAAAGRIPTNFLRREMGASDREILTSRVIDRSIRPLFPKGFSADTQVVCNLLSVDGCHDPDVVALNAVSASLASSDIPWGGPVGAVRVGCVDRRKVVVSPTRKEMAESSLNLLVTGDARGHVVMLEAEADNLDRAVFLDAVEAGLESCSIIAKQIRRLFRDMAKRSSTSSSGTSAEEEKVSELRQEVDLLCRQKVRAIFWDDSHDKISRDHATFEVRNAAAEALASKGATYAQVNECFGQMCRELVAELVLDEGRRVDGRGTEGLRRINCETGLHSPLHGSALFQRGQTQVLCTVSLDSIESSLKSDAVSVLTGALKEKNFFLHYEFPPYATNEIGRAGGGASGRRELGHGALAEKALRAAIPKDYPFAIRLTSEVLESNGSSSMASVCGGTLALLDAGVPLAHNVAGVAVGLVSRRREGEEETMDYQPLLDILGLEDFLGDMDFKMAGTKEGITALQTDVKLPGIPLAVVREATNLGGKGLQVILKIMSGCRSTPRTDNANLPMTEVLDVPRHKRGKFVGPGGINLRRITSETGARATQLEEGGKWSLFAPNPESMREAKELIESLLAEDESVPEFEFGAILTAKVVEIRERGILVELHPNMDPVMVHVSQLSATKVSSTSALKMEVGDTLQVKYFGRDPETGAIRLSRKALEVAQASAVRMLSKSAKSPSPGKEDVRESWSRRKRKRDRDRKDDDSLYQELDRLVNDLMSASREAEEAAARLNDAKEEAETARKKYVFLCETSWTNRLMAEGFRHAAHEKYQRAMARRKAVEETLRNTRSRRAELDREFTEARKLYLRLQEKKRKTTEEQ